MPYALFAGGVEAVFRQDKEPAVLRVLPAAALFLLDRGAVQRGLPGRLLLPQPLRDYAGLKKDVWVVGTQNRAEIWDLDEWNRAQDALTNEDVKALMDKIGF